MASPTLQPARPSNWIDPRKPGDYPVILGKGLKKDGKSAAPGLVNLRYNWQPKAGFDGRQSKLTQSGEKYQLVVQADDPEDQGFRYLGTANSNPNSTSNSTSNSNTPADEQPPSLALVFDKEKSAFVLESLSTLNLNLRSGPGYSSRDARELPQIPLIQAAPDQHATPNVNGGTDETPDATNPYDFRHFLSEARENVEKSIQQGVAGSRTPMSGVSTPIPGGNRFGATTPQFRPTPVSGKTTTMTPQKLKKTDVKPARATGHATAAAKAGTKRDSGKSARPLSKARISDSDEEAEDDPAERLQVPAKTSPLHTAGGVRSRPPAGMSKGHTRNTSDNMGGSPHIIINDDDGDLEIDMGSPPPQDRSRRGRVDPELFRSRTATPIAGMSANPARARQPPSPRPPRDSNTHARDRDLDVTMNDIEAATSGSEEDADIEEFDLGSPQNERSSVPQGGELSKDIDTDTDTRPHAQRPRSPAPPTPPAPSNEDDDDADLLAAELEAALEQADQEAGRRIGLGIGLGTQMDDDESEISEEE